MSKLEFAAQIVSALAWPTAVVVAALIFRSEVKGLLGRLREGELFGAKLTFGDKVEELEEELEKVRTSLAVAGATPRPDSEVETPPEAESEPDDGKSFGAVESVLAELAELAVLANNSPSYAVVTAWERADNILRRYERQGDELMHGGPPSTILHMRYFTAEVDRVVKRLRELRNDVAHGYSNPTAGEAVAFVENVDWVVRTVSAQLGPLEEPGDS